MPFEAYGNIVDFGRESYRFFICENRSEPENAVQRLQKLHNELKSVISIYDATNSGKVSTPDENPLEKQCETSEMTEGSRLKSQNKVFLPAGKNIGKKCLDSSTEGAEGEESLPRTTCRKSAGNWPPAKPGSAPSRTSTSTDNYESESILGSSPSANTCHKFQTGKNRLPKPETIGSNDLDFDKWLRDKSHKKQNANEEPFVNSSFENLNRIVDYSEDRKYESRMNSDNKNKGWDLASSSYQGRKSCRSRSESPRKESLHVTELLPRPVTSKNCSEIQREKILLRAVEPRPEIYKKIEKKSLTSEPSPSKNGGFKVRSSSRENTGKKAKNEEETDQENNKKWERNPNTKIPTKRNSTPGRRRSQSSENETGSKGEQPDLNQREKNSRGIKSVRLDNSEKEARELSRIIEKNNEKLEKMKISKNLAIDIAKQLKNKYDEIKNSKNQLMDRLQKIEKDNERLNDEVKKEKDSKIRLQQKVEHLKTESRTMLLEHEVKTREVLGENFCLKAKIKDMEKEYSEHLMERQKETDRCLKKRHLEKGKSQSFGQTQPLKNTSSQHKYENETQAEVISSPESLNKIKKEKTYSGNNSRCAEDDIKRLTKENSRLLLKIEELGILLEDRQLRIDSLEKKMKDLEDEFKKQKSSLKQKTDRLEDTNKELESIRQNSRDLEDQVKSLRQSIENFDQMHQNFMGKSAQYENQIKKLQEQIAQLETDRDKLKADLENEKDALLIKNKIIEDQQETIKQLRDKSEDVKNLIKKNQSLERLINIERDEKLELQEAVERLKWRKEELKRKIKSLEGDLLLAPQEVVRDLQKTQIVLHELENQVQIKQKEWELHLQSLMREKEQACSVAEFATKKLMQTTNEFQKQSEAHKRLHKVLAENLAEKERYLREVNDKISQNQLREMLAEAEAETKRLVRLTAFSGEKEEPDKYSDVWPHRRMEAITAMRYGDGSPF